MESLFFDDQEIEAKPGENLVQAARRAGIEIPHYCWHPELSVVASCRMCLVEVGEKKPDGTIAMLPRLVPACQTPAKANTVVKTCSDKVKSSQAQTLEYLLLNHPLDCSICDQAGECYLQDYTYKFGKAHSRLDEPKVQRLDKHHIGDQISLFTDRCVMCTRCVRFTREISGTSELHVINRGSVEEIDVITGHECNNQLAGNVVDLCPVGALCSKDFLYKKRVWWLKSADSVCPGCSTGCSISLDQNENQLYRLRPRSNPEAQGEFMCDQGRFGWKYLQSPSRLVAPRVGRVSSLRSNGSVGSSIASGSSQWGATSVEATASSGTAQGTAVVENQLAFADPWPAAVQQTRKLVGETVKKHAEQFVVLFSPFMTCEEAYLLASWARSLDKRVVLAMGPVPTVGEDDTYPKKFNGAAPDPDKVRFTIRKEKCPNRRGVEAVLAHFQSSLEFGEIEKRLASGSLHGAFIVGGYPEPAFRDSALQAFAQLECLIVVDILASTLTDQADVVLAGAGFAEREGSFVNHAGLAQALHVGIRPPKDARSDGRIFQELLGRTGLYHAESLREEMAKTIPAFRDFGNGDLGELGVRVLS